MLCDNQDIYEHGIVGKDSLGSYVLSVDSLSQLDSLIKDNVVFTILSERRLGPKLYAVFAEGRLEEFVPSR